MRQGIRLILDSINIKKLSANDMFLYKFSTPVAPHCWQKIAGIQNGYPIAIL